MMPSPLSYFGATKTAGGEGSSGHFECRSIEAAAAAAIVASVFANHYACYLVVMAI